MAEHPLRKRFPVQGHALGPALGPALLAGGLLMGCGSQNPSAAVHTLQGAGASFPAPIYQHWFSDLAAHKNIQVNYQSVGSGAGVRQLIANTVDFAATDTPVSSNDRQAIGRGVVEIPLTAGAIAIAYQLPGCQLKLSQGQLAGIFLGTIHNYKELGCSNQAITVVHRSDGSGTTYNFTHSLSAFSKAWNQGPGFGKSVQWPTGIGAKGNEGIAATVSQLKGGLGYVESSYVRGNLQAAAIANRAGHYAKPEAHAAETALATIALSSKLTGSEPNPAVGYPIVSFTWGLFYQRGNGAKQQALQKTFAYILSDAAQAQAPGLGYISLPQPVLKQARQALSTIQP
jgi:phosphate transport system substrate-binding protein